jgi:hypothetical protein
MYLLSLICRTNISTRHSKRRNRNSVIFNAKGKVYEPTETYDTYLRVHLYTYTWVTIILLCFLTRLR